MFIVNSHSTNSHSPSVTIVTSSDVALISSLFQEPSPGDGGNYVVKAVNGVGEKECTLALNFGGGGDDEENVPARIYEQPLLLQPNPSTLILEAHIHANPKPKVSLGTF